MMTLDQKNGADSMLEDYDQVMEMVNVQRGE